MSLAFAGTLALLALAGGAGNERFGVLTVDEVAALLERPGVYVFDANTPEVFEAGHLPGARFIPPRVRPSDLPADKGAKLVFYCKNPQ